ncbi:hypothetical protein F5B21DRAFT_528199 [Xylaria acuta]|nr:hypothetical protein F5B21DRAFT_528199 [Xylaria acuta]
MPWWTWLWSFSHVHVMINKSSPKIYPGLQSTLPLTTEAPDSDPSISIINRWLRLWVGHIYTVPGGVEGVAGSSLRDAFLPKLKPQANKLIGYGGDQFVRGQLKYYDVTFDETELSGNGTVMEKYFLIFGEPDRARTTTVIGIPLNIRNDQAARGHAARETKAAKAAEEEREKDHAASHSDYLKTPNPKRGRQTHPPIGTYIIDCKEIEEGWSGQAGNLSLDVRATDELGVFEASCDFSIVEGIMTMSTDKKRLEEHCAQLDTDSGDEYDDKRRPPKEPKASAPKSQKSYLKLRCVETGEGQIFPTPEDGTITFRGDGMANISGMVGLPCVDGGVSFTGRKTADEVVGYGGSWSGYSGCAYEAARVSTWH